jgi:hypothetical protein
MYLHRIKYQKFNLICNGYQSSYVDGSILSGQQAEDGRRHGLQLNLTHRMSQHINDGFVISGHHTLTVDFDDAMAHPNTTSFGDTTAQQRADDAILHTEAQLITCVRSFDFDFHHRWT